MSKKTENTTSKAFGEKTSCMSKEQYRNLSIDISEAMKQAIVKLKSTKKSNNHSNPSKCSFTPEK